MIFGLIIGILGSIAVLVGDVVMSWVDPDVVGFTLQGHNTFWGILALASAAIGLIVGVVALFTRHRKKLAVIGLSSTSLSFVFLLLVPFEIFQALQALQNMGILITEPTLAMFYGYHIAFFGAIVASTGFIISLAVRPIISSEDRLLRVALLWGGKVIEETTFTEKRDVTAGKAAKNDFVLPVEALGDSTPIFKANKDGTYLVGLKRNFDGTVSIGGVQMEIPEYVKKNTSDTSGLNYVKLSPEDWGVIKFGDLSLFFQFVQPKVALARRGFVSVQAEPLASLIGTTFVILAFFIAANLLWEPQVRLSMHNHKKKKLEVNTQIEYMPPIQDLLEPGEEEDTVGKKAGGEEGKFGSPDENPEKKSKVPKFDGKMTDHIDVKKVGLVDLLSSNKLGKNSAVSSILSNDVAAFSSKMAVAMAGTGSELVVGFGAGGMGFRGTGSGGGGTGIGRIHGLGRVDTGGGMGYRAGLGRKRARRVSRFRIGSINSTGFCSKSNIRSVVGRRAGMFRACYERRLQIKPNLRGKLVVRWTIWIDGSVKQAMIVSSTIHDSGVERCVLSIVRRMHFEKPKGGVCVIQWPMVFNPG